MSEESWGARLRRVVRLWEEMDPRPDQKALAGALNLNDGQVTKILKKLRAGDSLESYSPNVATRDAIASMLGGGPDAFADLSYAVGKMRSTVEEMEASLEVRRGIAERATALPGGEGAQDPLQQRGQEKHGVFQESEETPRPAKKKRAGGR